MAWENASHKGLLHLKSGSKIKIIECSAMKPILNSTVLYSYERNRCPVHLNPFNNSERTDVLPKLENQGARMGRQ